MKKLLLPILSLALLAPGAFAEAPKTSAPMGNSIYRPVPKPTQGQGAGKARGRITTYLPTLFYYTRDSVIAYRYTTVAAYAGSMASDYLGPNGARFVPTEEDAPASATVRSYASVTRRTQPGVGMVAPAPVKVQTKNTTRTTTTTSSIVPERNDLALK
jgi:hypothetical protein